MLEHRKILDNNIHVLEYDLKRNGINIDITKIADIHPGTKEWDAIQRSKEQYTAFNNMLKYCRAVANKNFSHTRDESIKWDLDIEYGVKSTENLTAQLYEEREKELKNIKHYQQTAQKLGGVGL